MSLQSCRCPCFGHILFIWLNSQVKEKKRKKSLGNSLYQIWCWVGEVWDDDWPGDVREAPAGWDSQDSAQTWQWRRSRSIIVWLCDSPPSLSQRKSWWESGRTVQAVSSWGAEAAQAALTTSTVILNNDDCGRAVDELDQNVGWSFRKKMSCCLVWDRRS